MVEMMRSSFSVLAHEFDNFLFASIGDDRNDIPLSVLSALARLNIDPWLEAAELTRLPRETATQRLASSITALHHGPLANLEHGTIAARLIALLPRQSSSKIASHETLVDVGDVTKFRAGMLMYVVLIVFMSIAQWLVASRQTPAQVSDANAPASSTVSPQAPPPNSISDSPRRHSTTEMRQQCLPRQSKSRLVCIFVFSR